jgi:hypothetical protein
MLQPRAGVTLLGPRVGLLELSPSTSGPQMPCDAEDGMLRREPAPPSGGFECAPRNDPPGHPPGDPAGGSQPRAWA